MSGIMGRILVVTAVDAERDAMLRGLRGDPRFDVRAGGVGQAAVAAFTATALAQADYDLVISAGIAGGFTERAEVGYLVVADDIVAADLGAQTPDGFLSLDELGFGTSRFAVDENVSSRLFEALRARGLGSGIVRGTVLTVSTVTGTAATAAKLAARVPGAAAEAMEGYGVAAAASLRGVSVIEVRAISNTVGPRDRAAWRIADALSALEQAGAVLTEVL